MSGGGTDDMMLLVVDDDAAIRQVIAEVLGDEGIEVEEAANGAEALAVVGRVKPAVILLDMQMPVMDGRAFARTYLAGEGPRAKVVVMTAARDAQSACQEVGGDDYLPKPFDIADLVEKVRRVAG